ncbi:MAG TPA: PQQ-dependent sugar dehydrogenase [Thermoanaerobaculia bacterium]|nr:PQQ-dependent sugar dehydrogenase [Thermoanaerobaculia bacterium]
MTRPNLGPRALAPAAPAPVLAAVLVLALSAAPPATGQPATPDLSGLRLEPVVQGLGGAVGLAHAGDERLFVVLQSGRIVIVRDGQRLGTPFLDLSGRVLAGGERGLLGLAFHPRYAENGLFFVDYTDPSGDTVISRFRVSGNPDRADAGSEQVLLRIAQPFANHNGGHLAFGPDGYLYVASGDGGSAFDPQCNAQDRGNLLGKILRLDVDGATGGVPYRVPPDNPFAGEAGARGEIWAYGLRNPWRFSFDRATGDLYIGDVGQGAREEVSFQPAASGGGQNYGWVVKEGTECTGRTDACPASVPACGSPLLVDPVVEYRHADDPAVCSITGGFVYRGSRLAGVQGVYFYGDYCAGSLWGAWRSGGAWRTRRLAADTGFGLTSFGEDAAGELYVVTAGGTLFRLTGPAEPEPPEPPGPTEPCQVNPTTLCLGEDGRFTVRIRFRAPGEPFRAGRSAALTADTGTFWFFRSDNVEVLVKVLDACAAFDRFWVFAAGLTNVETDLVVIDTETGQERHYFNAPGRPFAPVQDTDAFATCP